LSTTALATFRADAELKAMQSGVLPQKNIIWFLLKEMAYETVRGMDNGILKNEKIVLIKKLPKYIP
jgi:hypothetical protein